jgi:ketosteroid isomerase-like protein
MNGADGFVATWEGAEGLRAAWSDWLGVFATLRLEFESLDRYGDNLITVVRQSGTSRHGVELEQPSAAVWKFRDGMIGQLEFHLDREAALASAREED